MAESMHELRLQELPDGGREAPADGATDAVGMRQLIYQSGATVEAAAQGAVPSVPMDEARQLLNDAHSALTALGYSLENNTDADCLWSDEFQAATKQFQDDHELPTHGKLDADTYEALMEAYEQALETQSRGLSDEDDFNPVPGGRFFEAG
jgi:hypothetical protein